MPSFFFHFLMNKQIFAQFGTLRFPMAFIHIAACHGFEVFCQKKKVFQNVLTWSEFFEFFNTFPNCSFSLYMHTVLKTKINLVKEMRMSHNAVVDPCARYAYGF